MEHDTEPEKPEDRELREKQRQHHGIAPLHGGVMGGFYRVVGLKQLSAASGYATVYGYPLMFNVDHSKRFQNCKILNTL
jgi:hypothetical protein